MNNAPFFLGRTGILDQPSRGVIQRSARRGTAIVAVAVAMSFGADRAAAQAPAPNLVGACSGVSLPRSAVTDILTPVVNGIVTPVQGTVNPILGVVGAVLPLVPPLGIDAAGLLANAAAGAPITLQVLSTSGTVVGPADRCDLQADSFTLRTPQGIAIGGNRITGLGATGREALAGEASSIAFGDSALTDASAAGSIALGSGARVGPGATASVALGTGASATGANSMALGAGSVAARGPLAGYAVIGLPGTQSSAGEVSVGAPGAERQITNVAAGSAASDAVNVGQLAGVQAQIGTVASAAVQYDSATRDRVTLAGGGGTTIGNLAPGALSATSTEAVNGGQLFATNNAITNLTSNVTNGVIGALRYSDPGTPSVPNGGTITNDVTLVGAAAGPLGLHNVAAGVIAAGSTDAVNGGQLAALGQSTASSLGGLSAYDPATNSVTTSIRFAGAQYGDIQSAFDAVGGTLGTDAAVTPYFRVLSSRSGAAVTGADSIAIGPEATVSAGNSVALGTAATATRGATAGYTAIGLATPQSAAGEVSIGAVGAERQLTNVAAGTAPTDAANVGQLAGVQAQVAALGSTAVQYDSSERSSITLGGSGGTTITNVAAGSLSGGSTDAVNGAQLFATNTQVTNNTNAITALGNQISNGGTGPVQYSNPATPTTPNGGTRTNDVALVGAAPGPVGLHNVAGGAIAAGSTDAVNGGQVYALALTATNAVSYDTDSAGTRTNRVTLAGGNAAAPVTIGNVAAGTLTRVSSEAVNGAQLLATNEGVAAAQGTANTALTLGNNSVQYGPGRTTVTFNAGGAATVLNNVAAGVSPTDAVNVAQLNAGINSAVNQANAYTDGRLAALNFDMGRARRDAYAGTAGALAAAGLPQAYEAGKGMIAIGGGVYGNQSAVAFGASKAFDDGRTVAKLGATYDTRGRAGASGGIGYQF